MDQNQQPMMQQPMMQQPMMQQPMQQPMMQQNPQMMQQNPQMMQQQQMMMQGQQPMMMVQGNPINFMAGLDKLMAIPGIYVKQKFELLEAISGCETENKYVVYAADSDGDKKKKIPIFKCKEKSDCLARICLSGDCRPFRIKVEHEAKGASSTDGEQFMKCYRDCALTCLCCNRPELECIITENGSETYIGKIVSPFKCCNYQLDLYDYNNQLKYKVYGSCCQLGTFCKCPCEPCQIIDFEILDASGQYLSKMQKRSAGCLKSAISDTDEFSCIFPTNATKEDRALLMMSIIFLDFRYFEENPNQNNNL